MKNLLAIIFAICAPHHSTIHVLVHNFSWTFSGRPSDYHQKTVNAAETGYIEALIGIENSYNPAYGRPSNYCSGYVWP